MDYYYITGTSRGLGRAMAEGLLKDPEAIVIGISRRGGLSHDRYHHVTLDLSDTAATAGFRFEQHQDANRFVLVNNAAIIAVRYVGAANQDSLVDTLTVNAIAPAILMNSFLAAYAETGKELVICNITSPVVARPIDGTSFYGASKAALDHMTQAIAREAELSGRSQLRIFAVSPGPVDTEMQAGIRKIDAAEWPRSDSFRASYAAGRLVAPETVAARICAVLRNPVLAPSAHFTWNEVHEG